MHHARAVHGDEGFGERGPEPEQLAFRQRSFLPHVFREGGSGDVLGGYPRSWGVGIGVHDAGGPETADLAHVRHLVAEPVAEGVLLRKPRRDELDGDVPPTAGAPQIDGAHRTRPQSAQQRVVADADGIVIGQRLHETPSYLTDTLGYLMDPMQPSR